MTTDYLDDEIFGKVYDARLVRRLGEFVRPHGTLIAIGVVLLIAMAVLDVAGPLILKVAIDDLAAGGTDRLGMLTLLYTGTLIGSFVMRYVQAVIMNYVGQRVMMDLRMRLFAHLQGMSIAYFDRNPVGRLVTRLTNDISTLEQVLSQGIVQILVSLLTLVAIIAALIALDWRLALLMCAFLPPMVLTVRYFARSQREGYREQRMWLARINAYLNENLTGMAVVQLFNRERENLRRFDQRNRGLLDANKRVLFWYAVFEPSVVLFAAITSAAILWYGGERVLTETLTIGTLVAFTQYMQRFYWPVRDLADRFTTLQSAMASCERIFGVLDDVPEVVDVAEPRSLAKVAGRIEFRDVWFAYDGDQDVPNWVFRGVSFTIEPGEHVAIVGSTGAGKSTLMSLLNRLYDVQRGAILVDGVPITEVAQQALRRNVGMVLQDPFVFTDTVEENIRLRDPAIALADAHAGARLVGADTFIERMPQSYSTMLAERGANLSTGQKQLLSLARVAAFNPAVVLVMDEATASVDPETEATLQQSIRTVTSGRPSIVIAHRLNAIRFVDRILVLQRGEVVETGTHDTLMALGGVYRQLYELYYRDPAAAG